MLFVDGENFTFRGQDFANQSGIAPVAGDYYEQDVFIWLPQVRGTQGIYGSNTLRIEQQAIRAYYYTSLTGDDSKITAIRAKLWQLGFQPEVFKKTRQNEKAKGVDIALCKDMLIHAVYSNYDVAIIVAGDGDYVPLINEVKRLGKTVVVAFFENCGLNRELMLMSDKFYNIEAKFLEKWRVHLRASFGEAR
jgi:uncharacterized LabA/DUF88 family protein